MAPAAKVADNRGYVERHPAVRDAQVISIVGKEKPVRGATGTRQPGATRVEYADTVDKAVGGDVCMAADDDVGAPSSQQEPELLIVDAGIDSRAVVGLR
jgi:hypothetical protein